MTNCMDLVSELSYGSLSSVAIMMKDKSPNSEIDTGCPWGAEDISGAISVSIWW